MLFDRIVSEAHNKAYDIGYDHGRWGKDRDPSSADDAESYEGGYKRGVMKAEKKAAQKQYGINWKAALGIAEPKKDEPASQPDPTMKPAGVEQPAEKDYWAHWKEKQREKRSPEAQKIHDLAKQTFRGKPPIKRVAAGGLVFKNFDAPSVEDLQVLVAKTHPKWGGYWVIPKGGADLGEHIHGTASREVEEETGVKAEVIPGHEPFVKSSTFGESGKYDLELVAKTLKDAHPEEADFIEKHKDHLKHEAVSFENNSHYFLLKHVSGDPITSPDQSHDEEMSEARYMPIKEALKIPKVGDVIHGLMPEIKKQWEAGHKKTESLYARVTRR